MIEIFQHTAIFSVTHYKTMEDVRIPRAPKDAVKTLSTSYECSAQTVYRALANQGSTYLQRCIRRAYMAMLF